MRQKELLLDFLKKQKTTATLDDIMKFIDKETGTPRSTIRARLSELRKKEEIVKNETGWVIKDAKV